MSGMNRTVQDLVRHVCHEPTECTCCTSALEPDDNCPKHGSGPWPPRCNVCGKFLSWTVRNIDVPNIPICTKSGAERNGDG